MAKRGSHGKLENVHTYAATITVTKDGYEKSLSV